MPDAAAYSAVETLRDGRRIEIRALRPSDREDMIKAVGQTGAESFYRRFFSPRRDFTEQQIAYFVNVDFSSHVALVAVAEEDGRPAIVGGGRYIVCEPACAELAFAVIDRYQGQGVGSALLRHIVGLARDAGLAELVADVLPENIPMLTLLRRSGFDFDARRGPGAVHARRRIA